MREMVCYGGPEDGRILRDTCPPPGYRDTGMTMVYWEPLKVELIWPKNKRYPL